mmetsp:Transcript_80717/g.227155  ORF Transcript_80717/g.227155 Transcript_80717/m.227155 type:complete len:318 (+) Transcript_80717:404-1357(+)
MVLAHHILHLGPCPPSTKISDHHALLQGAGRQGHGPEGSALVPVRKVHEFHGTVGQRLGKHFLPPALLRNLLPALQGQCLEALVRTAGHHAHDLLRGLCLALVESLHLMAEVRLLLLNLLLDSGLLHFLDPALQCHLLEPSVACGAEARHDLGGVLPLRGLYVGELVLQGRDLIAAFPHELGILSLPPPNGPHILHQACLIFLDPLEEHVVAVGNLFLLELGQVVLQGRKACAVLLLYPPLHDQLPRGRCPTVEDDAHKRPLVVRGKRNHHLCSPRVGESRVSAELGLRSRKLLLCGQGILLASNEPAHLGVSLLDP